ncbi:MAG: adenylate/guanylate cyclase domain-containing protein, partial [Pyrinomonadaceae bacterium]
MALLRITDASRRTWEYQLPAHTVCTIGRAPENNIVLDDPRASRHHAHVRPDGNGMLLVDGAFSAGEIRRSANGVFVNGQAQLEHKLTNGDRVSIGSSSMQFEQAAGEAPDDLRFDDKPLGHTQMLISASEVMSTVLRQRPSSSQSLVHNKEMEELRRKAEILAVLYEMSRTLGSEFNLKAIFAKATDIIFRVTPADRVVALLSDGFEDDGEVKLTPIATKARDEKLEDHAKKLTVGRTITRKVMKEGVALLSQDAAAEFTGVDSIVSQGVRSTICAPLMTENRVHGALYADRLDLFAMFTPDDLELISAVAAQTAIAVESVRAHERLAKEEVARANYSRFLPEYVVTQMLENPESFKLGGVNQTITVLFADIRGFTRLSEHAKPEKVVQLLNKYFTEMTDIIFAHGGTLDKYIGDGLMALFGAPTATPDDACNALHAAVAMQRSVKKINEELVVEGFNAIGIGVGLHTGEATVGYIGSERRSEYTAIGDTVNLASRLESNCLGGQILISEVSKVAANCS